VPLGRARINFLCPEGLLQASLSPVHDVSTFFRAQIVRDGSV
jgi:hypothetical protein